MSKIELDRNNKTLYGQIADILRERIMSGEFKPGDILPSERELAEEMQVSRIPVREAMKSLEYLGVVGEDMSIETAQQAAQLAALNILAVLKLDLGDLDRIRQIVQVVGYVRCAKGFEDQPKVINGASQVFKDLWGDAGIAARLALGTNELPEGSPVEIMAVVELAH